MNRELKSAIVEDVLDGALSRARSLPLAFPGVREITEVYGHGSFTAVLEDGTTARFYVSVRQAAR